MVNSGSSANLLAIASLFYRKRNPLKRGDEVIVPAVSWSTTYSPLQQYGLKLKFVDIDLETLNYDLTSLKYDSDYINFDNAQRQGPADYIFTTDNNTDKDGIYILSPEGEARMKEENEVMKASIDSKSRMSKLPVEMLNMILSNNNPVYVNKKNKIIY